MVDLIAKNLPDEGLTQTAFGTTEPFTDTSIDKDQYEEFMEWEAQKATDSRVRKTSSRWFRS